MPEQRFIEQAARTMYEFARVVVPQLLNQQELDCLKTLIADALSAAATAPAGHIIDDKGVVRRVLGTLMLTIDGAVISNGSRLFELGSNRKDAAVYETDPVVIVFEDPEVDYDCGHMTIEPDGHYSSREAAQSARATEKRDE